MGLATTLFSPAVVVAESFTEIEMALFADELAYLAGAGAERRAEFTTSRALARRALARLSVPAASLVPGADRRVQWPTGTVGTITHCRGYRGVAVARRELVASVGLDVEPHRPLPDGVDEFITTPGERDHLADLARRHPGIHWPTLLFCAKEAVHKAANPLTGALLEFTDVSVRFEPDRFAATTVDGQLWWGRHTVARDLAAAAVEVPSGETGEVGPP
ncbi:4'-phosphopantetheinyl transferase family protein [Aestuariimicrobium ganziense]|uniref:4'-phosphopantetheinyl transferase family protein n=1 Tax=Aestuariimicrobium ganziense TaxID=2773677 RepID=UPI0019456881|nr:4'-phosphopantetheinyl transferase superfamily protein [Aestuariimicrobium ganziense]